jgi:hypothetical protein
MTPEQLKRLAELEEAARRRGSDYDPTGAYVYDPDAEHHELADDAGEGLTDAERAQLRELEAKFIARLTERCEVCARPLAAGQRRVHGVCSPTCEGCWHPTSSCVCTAAAKRKRAVA